MFRQKMTPVGIAFAVLILLIVAFMVRGSLRRPEKIVLPPETEVTDPGSQIVGEEAVNRVDVRPDTVQSVIAALARPTDYSRTITVERYWDGGSGLSTIAARSSGGWLRLDISQSGMQTRHVITGEGTTYVWYEGSWRYFSGSAALSQDAEQGILTYEDILAIPVEQIAAADYRSLESVNCIYVETAADAEGYLSRITRFVPSSAASAIVTG